MFLLLLFLLSLSLSLLFRKFQYYAYQSGWDGFFFRYSHKNQYSWLYIKNRSTRKISTFRTLFLLHILNDSACLYLCVRTAYGCISFLFIRVYHSIETISVLIFFFQIEKHLKIYALIWQKKLIEDLIFPTKINNSNFLQKTFEKSLQSHFSQNSRWWLCSQPAWNFKYFLLINIQTWDKLETTFSLSDWSEKSIVQFSTSKFWWR